MAGQTFPTELGQFKVGDYWRTRGGDVRRIVAVDNDCGDDGDGGFPLVSVGPGDVRTHNAEGCAWRHKHAASDLIEKVRPRRKAWVYFDPRDVAGDTILSVTLAGFNNLDARASNTIAVEIEFEVPDGP